MSLSVYSSYAKYCFRFRQRWRLNTKYRRPADSTRSGASPTITRTTTMLPAAVGGAGSCGGTITFTCTWDGEEGTEPEGTIVVVRSKVSASATMGGAGSATASNGMGDPTDNYYTGSYPSPPWQYNAKSGYLSNRTDAELYFSGEYKGHSFQIQMTPTGSTNNGPGGSVYVQVDVYPVTLDFTGPYQDGTTLKTAVAQRVQAQVNCSLKGDNDSFDWVTPDSGYPFENYQASSSSASFTPFSLPDSDSDLMTWYFGEPASSVSVECTYYCSVADVEVDLARIINSYGPTRTQVFQGIAFMRLMEDDYVWLSGGPDPNGFELWGSTFDDDGTNRMWGMWQVDRLKDPSFLTTGSGQWGYIQIKDRTSVINGNSQHVTGLDGGFPYPDPFGDGGSWTSADDETVRRLQDRPGVSNGLGPFSFSLSWDGSYDIYTFYKPANSAAGASVWIPIRKTPWEAKGQCSAPLLSGPWSQQDNGSAFKSGATDYPTFPTWS